MSKKEKVNEDLSYEMHFNNYGDLCLLDNDLTRELFECMAKYGEAITKVSVYVQDEYIGDFYNTFAPKED